MRREEDRRAAGARDDAGDPLGTDEEGWDNDLPGVPPELERELVDWDEEAFAAALARVEAEGVIEAVNVCLSSERLERLLAAAPRDPDGRSRLQRIDLTGSSIGGDVDFSGFRFSGPAQFSHTVFDGKAEFGGATFEAQAKFQWARFAGDARFGGATFADGALFHAARFARFAGFGFGTRFQSDTLFSSVVFERSAGFTSATFAKRVSFERTRFQGITSFMAVTFAGGAGFHGASFSDPASFSQARFETTRRFGPVLSESRLVLTDTVFSARVTMEASGRHIVLDGATFREGADLFLRWAEVSMERSDFAQPSLVAPLRETFDVDGNPGELGWEEPGAEGGWRYHEVPPRGFAPRVVSLRGAKVAHLTLSEVDLRGCRLAGAHGLDALRLEGVRFTEAPAGWRPRVRRARWTRRQTITEEHRWRAHHGHGPGWYEGAARTPAWVKEASEEVEAEQVAAIYRALRKGMEDDKDEPGAADFYYGEMEMRRHAGERPSRYADPSGASRTVARAERWTLSLYWLVSGYGLRASRALLTLGVVIALLALPLDVWGFRPDRSYGRAMLFAAESSISLLRAPETRLTASGQVIQLLLRIVGPVLFGLAALSLRGRVKR